MMQYIGNTREEQQEMLKELGVDSFEELLDTIPEQLRIRGLLNLPEAVSEIELRALAATLAKKNRSTQDAVSFLGGGAYDYFIPQIVDFLIFRSEFYTAYTPYQPEVSQGTLQAMYEYQSMICELTGMEVANASMYDGGSALAEAALMAARVTRKDTILLSETVNPYYRQIVETYCAGQNIAVKTLPAKNGVTDIEVLESVVSDDIAGVLIQSPNYYGCIEPLTDYGQIIREQSKKALFVTATNPTSLGILEPPSEADADIVIAEGQGLGNHQSMGGPYLGVFALKEKYVRKMPGRLVGATVDEDGDRGFVLVMKTREQDIRRERATSNICTNQGLMALAATVYMSAIGKQGIQDVANLCTQKAHYLAEQLTKIDDVSLKYDQPFFNEFVVTLPLPAKEIIQALLEANIFAGIDLGKHSPEKANDLLIAVTEKRTKSEMDAFVSALKSIVAEALVL